MYIDIRDTKLDEITSEEVVVKRGSEVLVFTRSVDDDTRSVYELPAIGKVEVNEESRCFENCIFVNVLF